MKKKKPKRSICWLETFVSSFARVIDSGATINLAMVPIDLEKATVIALGTKVVNARSQRGLATFAVVSKPYCSKIDLNILDLQKENEELLKFNKDFTKNFEKLLNEKCSLKSKNLKLLSKINDLELEVKKLVNDKEVVEPCKTCDVLSKEVCLKCDLLPDNWIMNSGCTKHMNGNRRLFTSYKAYDGGHVVFGSNLKGKVVGGGNITHDSITITNVEHVSGLDFNLISVGQLCDDDCVVSFTKVDCNISKNGKTLAKGHRRNRLYTCKLGDNSKQHICLASVVDNSTLWHRRLGHVNMRLVQNLASNELVRNLQKLSFERYFCDICGLGDQGNANNRTRKEVSTTMVLELLHLDLVGRSPIQSYGENFYTLMIVDDHSNYTWVMFVESKEDVLENLPEPKSSPSVEDDKINEPIVQDLNGSPSLQVNVSDEGYPISLKEARGHPIEQAIGELNERTLRSKTKQA
ncbi:retrovirus-related pol polyprotein from transposon TNT 1-94 [Tanacetum coccineum]